MRSQTAALVLAVVLLSGCAEAPRTIVGAALKDTFTNETGLITFQRQELIDLYATVRQLYVEIRDRAAAACAAGQIPGPRCLEMAEIDRQAKQLDFAMKAKIAVPETTLDWAVIKEVLSFAVKMVL